MLTTKKLNNQDQQSYRLMGLSHTYPVAKTSDESFMTSATKSFFCESSLTCAIVQTWTTTAGILRKRQTSYGHNDSPGPVMVTITITTDALVSDWFKFPSFSISIQLTSQCRSFQLGRKILHAMRTWNCYINYWITTTKPKENRQNQYSWKNIRLNKRPSYSKNAMDQPNDLKREAFYIGVITLVAEKYFKYDIKNYVDIGGCLKTAEAASICIFFLSYTVPSNKCGLMPIKLVFFLFLLLYQASRSTK